jgi:cytochrome c biogenesis protein CcmG, thiol:disulfide interchange protein DsbE
MKRYLLPLVLFVALAALFFVGLKLNPREVPSPFIGKPAPAFSLPQLHTPDKSFSPAELRGQVWVLNVFASWCTPCLAEHPLITALAQEPGLVVVGLNYKDKPEDAKAWLARHGDPYRSIAADARGTVGIDWGVYGVPETFVIDRSGIVRHKVIGPVTPQEMRETLLPLVKKLQASDA